MKESGEDYLETIYLLSKRKQGVHAVDIANELNFSKPSITRAMNILKSKDLIITDENNHIKLTQTGLKKAEKIYFRHQTLTQFLIRLGVSEDAAAKDACRIEHVLSEESIACIENFLNKNS